MHSITVTKSIHYGLKYLRSARYRKRCGCVNADVSTTVLLFPIEWTHYACTHARMGAHTQTHTHRVWLSLTYLWERMSRRAFTGHELGQFVHLMHSVELWHWPGNLMKSWNYIEYVISSSASTVSRCFEPSQPQSIMSGLKTNFNWSPSYSFHKSWNISHKN